MKNFIKNTGKYIALTALPLGALIALMYYYATDIPFGDEWVAASLLKKYHDGVLTFWDLFAQHNEHRVLTGKIIMLLNAIFCGWNMYLEAALNVLFAVGSSIVIYCALEKSGLPDTKKMLLYFTCACIIFSFSQQDNYMWGFQVTTFLSIFMNLSAIFLLTWGGNTSIFAAVIAGFLSTYSFANSMMIWPAGLCVILLRSYAQSSKINYWKILFWLVSGFICIGLYFTGYDSNITAEKISMSSRIISALSRPHLILLLFVTWLGAPLASYRQSLAVAAGLAGLAVNLYCFVVILRRKLKDNNFTFWLGADVYILLCSAVTAFGRQGTVSTAMALRYMSINMLFWVITPCLMFITLEKKHAVPLKIYLLVCALIISHSVSEHALIQACERYNKLNLVSMQLKSGIYDSAAIRAAIPGKHNDALLPQLKKWGVKFLANGPDTVDLGGFAKIALTSESISQSENTSFEFSSVNYSAEHFLNAKGWWKIDGLTTQEKQHCNSYIILHDGASAYSALLEPAQKSQSFKAVKDSNIFARWDKYFWEGDIYCGAVPSGTYNILLKVIDTNGREYYFSHKETIRLD